MNKVLSWAAVVIWMATIFYLSHQPGTTSSGLSSGITKVIIHTIETIAPDRDFHIGAFHHYVRKNAHFFAYMLLGILVLNALRSSSVVGYRKAGLALLICVLYAASDEIHQLFIAGRSGEIRDVGIDSAGACVGIVIWMVVGKVMGRKKQGRVVG
jgi:VanZ family protein